MPGDASAPTHATDAPERVRGAPTVVVEGRNCWRIARASRVAFLVDADAYFRALTQTLLILLFDPVPGALYALGGSVAAAAVAHTVGRTLWGDALRQLAGPHLARVARSLARHGVLSVAIVRLLPVAPFTIVNLVAGGIGVRASTFLLGTVLGMAPGVALFAVLAHMLWP